MSTLFLEPNSNNSLTLILTRLFPSCCLESWVQPIYKAATIPAIAMAAAAKLPTFCTSRTGAAALPVELEEDPEPVGEAEAAAEVRPRLDAAATPEADVTTVVVQLQSEL